MGPSMQLSLVGHGWKALELVPSRRGYDAEMGTGLGSEERGQSQRNNTHQQMMNQRHSEIQDGWQGRH